MLSNEQIENLASEAAAQWATKTLESQKGFKELMRGAEVRPGGQTVVGRIIDVLSRGEYASANLVNDYIIGRPFNIDSAIKGLKGETRNTFPELVDRTFPEWGTWKRKALGFGLSIFADPTTYIPMGAISKGVKRGAEALKSTEIGGKISKIADETLISKAFRPQAGLPKAYYEAKYYAKKGIESRQEEILGEIKELRSGLSKQDMKDLSYFREHPKEVVPGHLRQKLKEIGQKFDDLVDRGVQDGIITPQQAERWRAKETPYVAHYYPERGINIAKGQIPPSLFEKVKKPAFLKERSFETMEDAKELADQFADISKSSNLAEVRAKISKYGLNDAFSKGQVIDFDTLKSYAKVQSKYYLPEENILKAYGIRASEQAGYTARRHFVDETIVIWGKKVDSGTKVVPEGYGIYLPKGSIRMYGKDFLEPNFIKNLEELADKLRDLRIKSEQVTTERTTTRQTIRGGGEELTGPMARLKQIISESLQARGMTEGEASVYIEKLRQSGSSAVDRITEEIRDKVETTRTVLGSERLENELININELTEAQKKHMVGVTTNVETFMMPESIAEDLNKFSQFFIGDPTTSKLVSLFDKGQNAWKTMATTVRLPFHLRNMYSNWWQMYIAGVSPLRLPDRLIEAAGIQSGKLKRIKLGGRVYTRDELVSAINELGIHGKGWIGSDIPKKAFNEIKSIVKYGKIKYLNPVQAGRFFGTVIEDNARIGLFLDQVSKGKTFKEASQQVRKYMFDYTELTDFEKNVMRRVLPFYTWSRKNIPLQIENLLSQPRKYQVFGKGERAFSEREIERELKLKPKYFDELLYVKSPFKTEKGKPIYMSIDLPPGEFNRMTSVRHWLSGLTPYILFAQLAFNFKTFPEISKIQEKPLEKARAPFWIAYLPGKVLDIMEDKHIVGKIVDRNTGQMIMGMDKKWLHAINTAMPFLTELNRISAQPIYLEDESPEMKWKSYYSGISRSAVDMALQEQRDMWGKLRAKEAIENFSIQHQRPPTKSEMKKLDPDGYLKEFMQ